jgi:hypothetical protein
MNFTSLKAAVLPSAKLEVLQEDGSQKDLRLVMDFNALAKANAELGRDFADIKSWQNLNSVDTSTLCWCAFQRFHPDVTLEQVRSWLGPAQIWQLYNMLLELSFPGILERVAKKVAESGEFQPNPPEIQS